MKQQTAFYKSVLTIAIPVTLQSLLQSSFSVIDQIMIGQLGSTKIAAIGLAGKFSFICSTLLSAIATAAGIMIAQYIGQKNNREMSRSFWINLSLAAVLAGLFTILCVFFPEQIMGMYTKDRAVMEVASSYLRIVAVSYLPMAASLILPVLLRCMEEAMIPLYAAIGSAVLNTVLNYMLIFGKSGFPKMEVEGAAIATVISQFFGFLMILVLFIRYYNRKKMKLEMVFALDRAIVIQYAEILLPILVCEFFWSLGENVYASIYGHLGTIPCAAMELKSPLQMLMIGSLNGLAQAAGVLIGKMLGAGDYERAYWCSKKLMKYGMVCSCILSVVLLLTCRYYVQIYQVEPVVREIAVQILIAFALICPIKVQNMILGGGIIRSGGRTKYIMWVDIIGTWCFGVPLGLLAAFVWKLSIPYVYFVLSLEECVRYAITLVLFKKRGWMRLLSESGASGCKKGV